MIHRVEALSDGFLVPVFFGAIGSQTDLFLRLDAVPLAAVALIAAVVGTPVVCGNQLTFPKEGRTQC
ncbi:hypothetical protein [Paracoccus sp. NSM]|uniref:hypothetical protein n=1 Tax=Paracoccus sp. NSM TaxID=3457784 RepID=UPI00403580F0